MSLETMTKLAPTVVTTNGQATVSFTNIPQGYSDLKVVFSTRGNQTGDTTSNMWLTFNNSSTTSTEYSSKILYGNGSAGASASESSNAKTTFLYLNGPSSTSSVFASGEIYISNYSGNTYKSFSIDCVTENNATAVITTLSSSLWSNPSPITTISFQPYSSTFAANCTFTLYGIKNAQKTAGNSIKATGGNIVFDGTYVYHVFPTTGAFVPTQPLTADVLVVAGGGSAGYPSYGDGGGGGAGGIAYSASQSFASAISYTATVGAGGATATGMGIQGNTSSCGGGAISISVVGGGGGGGGAVGTAGTAGGAGACGGGSQGNNTTGGTGSIGFNGGSASSDSNRYGAGGGGGMGGIGGNAASGGAPAAGGNGGAGVSTYSSWGIATGVGQNVSGTYWLAGGGGGGGDINGNGGNGGGGTGTNGTVATGGGGGGKASGSSGAGGSGIIIVRYKG